MKKEIWSIPNILCYVRILLLPLFAVLYLRAQAPGEYYMAAGVLALSGVTDFLDGWIARRFHMVTELGKIIDPVADKLTQATVAVCLGMHYPWMWLLFGVFAIKEITTGIVSLIQYRKGLKLDGALWFGKVATAVFYGVTVTLVAVPFLIPVRAADVLILVATGFLLFAFVRYIPVILRLSK